MPVSVSRCVLLALGFGLGAVLPVATYGQVPGTDTAPADTGAVGGTGSGTVRGTVQVDPTRPTEVQVPYVPTPMRVVDEILELAEVGPEDVVYDLGSGDGRIVIRAAKKYGARAVGYEIDSSLVAEARRKARDEHVAAQVTFYRKDLFDADLSDATVVTLYLLRSLNLKLRPKLLRELDPGDRVVSHDFDMKEWEPDAVTDMFAHRVYLWRIPEEIPDHLRSEASD